MAHLRSGDHWQERLRAEILRRDVLYLFWSEAASKLTWVEWEWRCALQERGIDFIDPVPLVSPQEVPPPPELAGLSISMTGYWLFWAVVELSDPRCRTTRSASAAAMGVTIGIGTILFIT